ncbi:MAG: PTS transporter subunit EIIB [Bacilli bacterium]|nr:PTS transporter subunit EIIB [Bacilli bacterium]
MRINLLLIENNIPLWGWILIVPVCLIVVLAIVAFIIRFTKTIKVNRKGKKIAPIANEDLLLAYGGMENIESVSKEMTRLTVSVVDLEKVNPERIKELGAKNVLIMGNQVKSTYEDIDNAYACLNGGK